MKHSLLLFLLALAISLVSCKQEKATGKNLEQLKKQMNASPNLAKYRAAFNAHLLHLSSYSPDELNKIHDQMKQCGTLPGKGSIESLKKCLAGLPNINEYIESEIQVREFESLEKVVANEFPELWEMAPRTRAEILFSVNDIPAEQIEKLLSKPNPTIK